MITKTIIQSRLSYKIISDDKSEQICQCDWRCLSTDNKPTKNVAVNDLLTEIDTGKKYYYDGADWQLVGD
jgi:hypothetical protein